MSDEGRYHVVLPPELRSPSRARKVLRDALTEHDLLELQDAAEVALSELVTNAVLHAHTLVEVTVSCSDTGVRVEVRDGSTYLVPEPRVAVGVPGGDEVTQLHGDRTADDPEGDLGDVSTTGRGMALVAAVSDTYGITADGDHGKTVWFAVNRLRQAEGSGRTDATWDGHREGPAASDVHGHVRVTLQGFPPTLWLAASLQHDTFLRELALLTANEPHRQTRDALAAADRARFAIRSALSDLLASARAAGAVVDPLPEGHPARLDHVPPRVDLSLALWPDAAKDFSCLQDVLDEAQRMALAGRLLASPALPEIIALRDWAAEQVITLLAGEPGRPWPGADADAFTRTVERDAAVPDEEADELLGGAARGILVDTHNRISAITGTLAEELGWDRDDLIGRRVVALIPARFRESHTAGFTRHLTTGEARALDVDLQLPVLHAHGRELPYVFRIQALHGREGRPVYGATLRPVADNGVESPGTD